MPLFMDKTAQEAHDDVISWLQERVGEELPEGDERRIFAEALTAYLVAVSSDFADRARQRLLRYARGSALDAIGEMYGCDRLLAQSATCTLRFSVEEPASHDVAVPIGTLAATGDGAEFATTEDAAIPAGATSVDVPAEALDAGADGNGLVPGTVSVLEDALEDVVSVANVDQTVGGSDGETDDEEGNEAYRARIRLAQNSVNTAGAAWAYRYHAMSARDDVADAQVPEPDVPCVIDVYVLRDGGGEFSPDELAEIQAAVAADDVRPLCDRVTVRQAAADPYEIDVSWTCPAPSMAAAVEAIEGDGGAIDRYAEWQAGAIGRDVNPQKLMAMMFEAGASTVSVRSPAAGATPDGHYAICTGRAVDHAEYQGG